MNNLHRAGHYEVLCFGIAYTLCLARTEEGAVAKVKSMLLCCCPPQPNKQCSVCLI